MNFFSDKLFKKSFFNDIPKATKINHVAPYIISNYNRLNKTIFVVCPNISYSTKLYDMLINAIDIDKVLFYPGDNILTRLMSIPSIDFKSERLYTIRKLLSGNPYIVICDYNSFLSYRLSKRDYLNSVFELKSGDSYDINNLIKLLEYNGYHRTYTVEKKEDYAIRGSILDIYTINNLNPIRIDFFGNTIEEIKEFNIQTQRSINKITSFEITPVNELFYTNEIKDKAIQKINAFFDGKSLSINEKNRIRKDIDSISLRHNLDSLDIYSFFFNDSISTLEDFSDNSLTIYIDKNIISNNIKEDYLDLESFNIKIDGNVFSNIPLIKPLDISNKDIVINNLFFDEESIQTGLSGFNKLYFENSSFTFIVSIEKEEDRQTFIQELQKNEIDYTVDELKLSKVNISSSYIPFSGLYKEEKLCILNDKTIFFYKRTNKILYRSVLNQTTKIHSVDEIQNGDYVVHYNYGIAIYRGLVTKRVNYLKKDYLELEYLNKEKLFVPIEKIDYILKYSSFEDEIPKLTNLHSKEWSKTKAHIKKKIFEMSNKLLLLQAEREKKQRTPYVQDDENQVELELDFAYEETPDQLIAINKVKEDMYSPKLMDRLIIGDVGFGKTEVALRVSFKAVLSGRQVAYLVPTTVLARQHYLLFKERLEKYGVSISMLSRFVSPKEIKNTIAKLKGGYIDIVVGTHRLLSNDVIFNNLGLLVIDEEQRFGVAQKIKINEKRSTLDILSLSATPIPRTLQLALFGIKDFSIIDTPPQNRYPIQTYVSERNDVIIKNAIRKEISRGGQVFYLFNNIEKMETYYHKLKSLIPEAKISYIHSRMPKEEIEYTISRFISNDFDVLISTTIIETGIDIPNSNTLIIHDANKLGLSQLYQLRGRVGRSDKVAYAYLFYDDESLLTSAMIKRLEAIKEFNALGSGYKIAKRDLAIRGAGDILGSEQSGFIESIGIELYTRLISDAIEGKSSFEFGDKNKIDGHYIDDELISNDSVKLEIHRKIMNTKSVSEAINLKDEVIDRFGKIDLELEEYIYEILFKKLIYKLGNINYAKEKNEFILYFEESNKNIDFVKLHNIIKEYPFITSYRQNGIFNISTKLSSLDNHYYLEASKLIERYLF